MLAHLFLLTFAVDCSETSLVVLPREVLRRPVCGGRIGISILDLSRVLNLLPSGVRSGRLGLLRLPRVRRRHFTSVHFLGFSAERLLVYLPAQITMTVKLEGFGQKVIILPTQLKSLVPWSLLSITSPILRASAQTRAEDELLGTVEQRPQRHPCLFI